MSLILDRWRSMPMKRLSGNKGDIQKTKVILDLAIKNGKLGFAGERYV